MKKRIHFLPAAMAVAIFGLTFAADGAFASGPAYYVQGYSCQYYGGGESSSVERTPVKIYNGGGSSVTVLCPIPKDSSGSGTTQALSLNVKDSSSTYAMSFQYERRSNYGTALETETSSSSGSGGNQNVLMGLDWASTSYYDIRVTLPPDTSVQLYSYFGQRQ